MVSGGSAPPGAANSGRAPTNSTNLLHPNPLSSNPPNSPRQSRLPSTLQQQASFIETEAEKAQSAGTDEHEEKGTSINEKEPEDSTSQFICDPAGKLTHDETTVDIVTVPCPGADALRSWNRDGLVSRYFGAPSMRDAEVERPESGPSWVRQGIRREADVARILLYNHPDVVEGTTLGSLADDLLEKLRVERRKSGEASRQRPVIFIAHSIGGLVVKMALAKANRDSRYEDILRDCYGVAFFGTPHQGSSYFAMHGLASSIQSLLQLSVPLPTSITDELHVGNRLLLHADEDFKCIAHDMQVWTMYETIESRLSGGEGDSSTVYFTAPLASIKSAILGIRQERIFPLQSDHANVASFGRHNTHTLRLFLHQLAMLIDQADESVREDGEGSRWTLNLEQRVNVEVHGFYEDSVVTKEGDSEAIVRAWSTRLPLKEFLRKGPEECLTERLHEVEGVPEEGRFLRARGRTMSLTELDKQRLRQALITKEGLGIKNQLIQPTSPPLSPVLRPVDALAREPHSVSLYPTSSPYQVRRISSPASTPPIPTHLLSTSSHQQPVPVRLPQVLIRSDIDQDLAVDRLSPSPRPRSITSFGRSISDQSSRQEYRDFPPFSPPRSRRSTGDKQPVAFSDDDSSLEASPRLPEAVINLRKDAKNSNRRSSETAIADEQTPAALSRPEISSRKFIWVHLQYNNPTWVKKILETLQNSNKKDYSPLYNNDFWATKHTRGRHAQHYAYYAKPGCYFTAPRTLSFRGHSISPTMSPSLGDDGISICLFLPYLHFDSYKRLIRRRQLILERLGRGRAQPTPEDIAKVDSIELQVIWEFLGHDPPINCRRTLDQYGYPSLRDTRARDDDQMLYKLTKERDHMHGEGSSNMYAHSSSSRQGSYGSGRSWRERTGGLGNAPEEPSAEIDADKVLNGNVLMVDQMWLWVIQSHTLLSFFPKRESDPIEGPLFQQADLRDSIFNEVNVDGTHHCENALDLAALAALHAVSVLLDRSSHPDLEIFRIFEEAISVLTEKLTSSLKEFRVEGFRDKSSEYEPVENGERTIRARHKQEGRRSERENRDNTSALLELRDLQDELLVLLNLFERQHTVLTSMLAAYASPQLRDRSMNGRAYLAEGIRRVDEYKRRAEEMDERVRSTRDDYDKLLQMVQRQAQVDEVRLSRLHADLASAQSRSVMIFTVFTVIFLPLTFFTGLFGMNTQEWDAELPTIGYIGAVALPSSVALIVTTFSLAFSTRTRRVFRWARDILLDALHFLAKYSVYPVFEMATELIQRRREERESQRESQAAGDEKKPRDGRRAVLKKEASDFWARHRGERDSGYKIPEMNRKAVGRNRSSAKPKDKARK